MNSETSQTWASSLLTEGPEAAVLVLDSLNDAVLVADQDNRIIYANPAVTDLLGWQPSELLGQPVPILVPERLRPMHGAGFERYRRTGNGHMLGRPTRVPALTKAGEERLIELVLSPVQLAAGHAGVAATLRDVGDRVDLERQSAVASHLLRVFSQDLPEAELIPAVLEALGRSLEMAATAFWAPTHDGDLMCQGFWRSSPRRRALEEASAALRLRRGQGLPGRVWASGEPAWISQLAEDPNYPRWRYAVADGLGSAFAFPVRAGGLRLGVVEIYTPEEVEPDESLLALSSLIGRRLGEAMRSARMEAERRQLAEREHAVAAAFRNALLPAALPHIPGMAVGAAFHPGGEGVVGGDFYDLYAIEAEAPAGRVWGFAIGDVCGTGAEAAAVTAHVRYSSRALMQAGVGLEAITQHINRALLERGDGRFCTCILGRVEPDSQEVRVTFTNGGHPHPIVRRAGGAVERVASAGKVLGVLREVDASPVEVRLRGGDLVVLYTDGITEARSGGRLFGEERLVDLVASLVDPSPEEVAATIRRTVHDFTGGAVSDDMAVLVLGCAAIA